MDGRTAPRVHLRTLKAVQNLPGYQRRKYERYKTIWLNEGLDFVAVIQQSLFPALTGLIRVSLLWLQPGLSPKDKPTGGTSVSSFPSFFLDCVLNEHRFNIPCLGASSSPMSWLNFG